MLNKDFYRGWDLPSNGTIGYAVLGDIYKKFQGQTFSIYAFAIKAWRGHRDDHGWFASIRMAATVELLLLVL